MKKVYICSPCRGDYENNIQRAKEYSRAAAMKGCIPIAPHIYLTQFMDDTIPAERELALSFGRELVLQCDELWAFGLWSNIIRATIYEGLFLVGKSVLDRTFHARRWPRSALGRSKETL